MRYGAPMGWGNQFRSAIVIAAAWIVASGVVAVALALLLADISYFKSMFVIVALVSGLLGLPIYLAARAQRNDTSIVAAVIGFIVGAVIPAVVILSGPAVDEAWSGGTTTVINGSYTAAGWLENFALIGFFGLVGVGGALAFWKLVGRRSTVEATVDASSPKHLRRTPLLAATALGVIVMVLVIARLSTDRSCHNTLRAGQTALAEAGSFDLSATVEQWRNIEREVDAFGRAGNWSIRSDVRTDERFPSFQISLCREPGTNILILGMADQKAVIFTVYQSQGGSGWLLDFRRLHEHIRARWPDNISYRDAHGMTISSPAWIGNQQTRKQQ